MLSLGEKVKILRKNKNISQMNMASIIGVKTDKIVDVEAGKSEYSPRHIQAIKELFDIVGMPLEDSDRPAFVMRLYRWRDYARDERISEAKKMREEMFKVVNLEPCDYDIVMLYKIFEANMLITEDNYLAAEKELILMQSEIDRMSNESLFHYYYYCGCLSLYKKQYESSLNLFLKACELLEFHDNLLPGYDRTRERLYYNAAWCYSRIDIPYHAISFLHKAKEVYSEYITNDIGLRMDNLFAQNYIKVNQLYKAEKILDECLVKAQGINDYFYISLTMHNLGLLHKKAEDWKTAISYFDQAMDYSQESSDSYKSALFRKAHCLVEAREFPKAQKLLEQAIIRYSSDEAWTIRYEALWHYLIITRRRSVYNKESSEYIKNVAIPYFENTNDCFLAVDYCKLLELHYQDIRSLRNASLMTKKIRDIYERCFVNPEKRIVL